MTSKTVAHTHRQVDNEPCPNTEHDESKGKPFRDCAPGTCIARKIDYFEFEKEGRGLLDSSPVEEEAEDSDDKMKTEEPNTGREDVKRRKVLNAEGST